MIHSRVACSRARARPPGFQLRCGAGGGCSRRGGRLPRDCTLNSNTHCAQTCRDNRTLLQKITRCHTHARVSRHTLALSVHVTVKMRDSAAEMRRPALTGDITRKEEYEGRNGVHLHVSTTICMLITPIWRKRRGNDRSSLPRTNKMPRLVSALASRCSTERTNTETWAGKSDHT